MLDTEFFAYGFVTTCGFVFSLIRSSRPVTIMWGITTLFWFVYNLIDLNMEFSREQVALSIIDAIQGVSLLAIAALFAKSWRAFFAILGIFAAMFGLHIAMFDSDIRAELPYHQLLNWAYVAQLVALGGLILRDERARHRHVDSDRTSDFLRFGGGRG